MRPIPSTAPRSTMCRSVSLKSKHHQLPSQGISSSMMKKLRIQTDVSVNKSVSFASKSKCLVIPSLDGMSEAEKDVIFVTPKEVKDGQVEIVQTVRAARRGQLPSPSNEIVYCTRGLEDVICPTTCQRTKTRRVNLINAVLDAQDKEWQKGAVHVDPNVLKGASERFSWEGVDRAIVKAASDEAYCRVSC